MSSSKHSEITPDLINLADKCYEKSIIDNELFIKYDVKRGLRDLNGRGVLTGLTHISDVRANKIVDGEQIPLPGELFYRGYNVKDLVKGFSEDNRFGFEEIAYLLLFRKKDRISIISSSKNSVQYWVNIVLCPPDLCAISS